MFVLLVNEKDNNNKLEMIENAKWLFKDKEETK